MYSFENLKEAFDAGMNCPVAVATFEEWLECHGKKISKTGVDLITDERKKQIKKHGFTAEHHALNSEKWYSRFQLQTAAKYLLDEDIPESELRIKVPINWDVDWFERLNKRERKERLVIAGALIAAELDRLNYIEEHGKVK